MNDLKLGRKIVSLLNVAFCMLSIVGCQNDRIAVDKIVTASKIYVCNNDFDVYEAMAITDGKIVAVGTSDDIHDQYISEIEETTEGVIYPGFIDAHSHFYGYGITLNKVDLKNTTSMENVVQTIASFAANSPDQWVTGRGWDETKWEQKGMLSNVLLNVYFPDRPVFIKRIDGHKALANQKAMELAGITIETEVAGGEIGKLSGRLTGVLMDNAMELVEKVVPKPSKQSTIQALLKAQEKCLAAGLTTVTDAGLDLETILLIDSLQKTGDLKIRLYVMANPTEENWTYFEKNGPIETDVLQVSSFKLYADGSLGSRGAKLKKSYCDHDNYTGIWVTSPELLKTYCQRAYDMGFQVNTHCIGDSANRKTLETYAELLKGENDKRWRIEHAQVVSPSDRVIFQKYSIIPSVQPTHATSDMRWAQDRLCVDRMDGAYAYKSLLATNGYLPLGTDFPVEEIYPLHTFFAAVYRQNREYKPLEGFLPNEALTTTQALLGMTLWAAKGNMMETKVGSLEKGKLADYVVLDTDITKEKYMLRTKVLKTYLAGILAN